MKVYRGIFQSSVRAVVDFHQTNPIKALVLKDYTTGTKSFVFFSNGQLVKLKNEAIRKAPFCVSNKEFASVQGSVRARLGNSLGNPAVDNAALQGNIALNNMSLSQYSFRLIVGDDKTVNYCHSNIPLVANRGWMQI